MATPCRAFKGKPLEEVRLAGIALLLYAVAGVLAVLNLALAVMEVTLALR